MMKTDEDRNVIRVIRGHLGFSKSEGSASEISGVAQSSGVWLAQSWSLGGWSEWSQGSGRGSILDQMGSWQLDGDLNNLTRVMIHPMVIRCVLLFCVGLCSCVRCSLLHGSFFLYAVVFWCLLMSTLVGMQSLIDHQDQCMWIAAEASGSYLR